MEEQPLPTSIPEVEALILSLYQPNPPETIARTQATLSRLQGSPQAWGIARDLLGRSDEKVKFFGALTIIIKLNNESSSLTSDDAVELLLVLIGWYLDSLRNGTGPLVIRKLASALATFFLHFHRVWRRFTHHLCLCLASSQPLRPDALDDAPESSALIESLDSAQTQAALWVLSNVLEDIAKFDLNSASNMGLYDAILENIPAAVALMSRGMSPQSTSQAAHQDSIKCLQSWVWFAQRASSRDTRLSEPIGPLVTAVISSLTVDELYDASVELMVDLLSNCSMFLTDAHIENLAELFDSSWFQNRYQALMQGDFDFDSVQFGQLLLAFGDAKVEKLMQLNDRRSQNLLSNLCGLLAAQGYPVAEDKVFVPALEFWSTYAETMTDAMYSDEGAANTWVPQALSHVLQAVSNAWQKVVYPPHEEFVSWDSNERIGFNDARKDVIDLLQSVYSLAGPQLVVTFADLVLKALSGSSWLQLEAAAFCLGGLADCVGEDTRCDGALASVFTSPLFSALRPGQADIPPKARQTCVALIEHYTEYFERNISHLPPALNLLFVVVGEHPMASAAAKSIYRLCSSCRGHLHTEAEGFLNEYQNLVSGGRLDCGASEKISGGIASVIQAIPDSNLRYSSCARLLSFVQADVQRSLELLHSPDSGVTPCFVAPTCSYAASDESPALHTALKALRCLASIGRGLQAPDVSVDLDGEQARANKADPQLSHLQESIMTMIGQIQGAFNTSGEVVEIICTVLRSGFSEVEPGPFVLPPHSVAQYLTNQGLETPRVGLLVSTACSFVSSLEHDGLQSQHAMLNSVLLWVVGLLKQLPNPEADPELSQNGIEFVTRLLSKSPVILLRLEPQNAAEFFFLFTLQVLDGKEPLPKASAAVFWAVFVDLKCDSQELNDIAQQAMQMLGPLLAQSLARNIGGNASRSELDKLSEPLKKLVVRCPMAKSWLEAGLGHESFPSTRITPQEKSMFLKKVISLRGARATNQVVREFWLSAKGSSFAYAS
ncbi:member of the karyopherin-beta [Fusarium falciforme]|uniref:Member of the karyopherin-beta n=1 Tax=Fusarium falciforme TaxID=195108 RepID=A0A9W8RH42_9HYPO|nr:member of the karyopherin-beta [Fusarium falciforme]KAJ4207165.1 member of the karyopherin-beta [Fusarium falciforme]